MDDGNYTGGDRGVRLYCSRAAKSDSGLIKSIETMQKIVRAALFAMLPWNAYAEAERFPGVQEQLDGLENSHAVVDSSFTVASSSELYTAVGIEAPAQEPIPGQAETGLPEGASLDVSTGGENAQSGIVNQELASLDAAVGIDNLRHIQDPQPAPIVSRDAVSLEVVDTGATRDVQNPQPAAPVAALETGVNVSTSHETDELNTGTASGDDQHARNYKLMLPVTDVAMKNEITGAVVEATGKNSGKSEDASGGTAGNEAVGLPYPVLLAILALMSMIPVARRNG